MRRTEGFQRSSLQEELLSGLNRRLAAAEQIAIDDLEVPAAPTLPVVFVIGAPRSGTTLTMQWLAMSGVFAYPTNLLSRFYKAPITGTQIQSLLTDPSYDFNRELAGDCARGVEWHSDIGKTSGPLQPHEFSYFWRRFFPMDQARRLTVDEWRASDVAGFARGIAGIQTVSGKPFAAKGILGQYNLVHLAEALPTAIFIHTQRDPFYNAQSILRARERVYGDRHVWFSVQPPGWEDYLEQDPLEQVVAQVMLTNQAIADELACISPTRWINQPYDAFCSSPGQTWERLRDAFHALGVRLPDAANTTGAFQSTNRVTLDSGEASRLHKIIAGWR